ncbi:cytochrome P450 71A8-like [Salvia miltiorrhiza]|uniref:cytochrome P450 71A8-like n=1 Tax=Salvia miltiorrhiza TaxID=226208 RepID=UPI0025ABE0DD|nr:cytochrome P450 71A8-like [Salvia miltiorrhiza]
MSEIQIQCFIYPFLASLILLWCISRWYRKANGIKNPPPSPPKLPILGNLHQLLGSFPHQNLDALAKKHGPLMLLHFGNVPVLMASSADAAREIMRVHDLTFSKRPVYKVHRKVVYDGKDLTFAPYGEYWKQMRGIFVLKLLSSKRVQSVRCIREEETALFMKNVQESSGEVNLSQRFYEYTYDVICRSAFGNKYSGSEIGKKFLLLVAEFSEILGAVGFEDFVPWLGWIDRVSGFDEKINRVARGLDDFLENVMQERLDGDHKEQENFLDIMLQIYKDKAADFSIDRQNIKALILDVFAAGTDTSSIVLEWAMTELLRNPSIMRKLQKEVREIVKQGDDIRDEDLEKMQYLKGVIKETFRYHPPIPLLLPRIAADDLKMKGFDVAAGTVAMVNVWAIGRDPASWDEPQIFKPERC